MTDDDVLVVVTCKMVIQVSTDFRERERQREKLRESERVREREN